MMNVSFLVLSLLLSAAGGQAADPPAGEKPAAREETGAAKPSTVYLRGGGVLIGRLAFDHIGVETRYGRLTVPLEEMFQVRFARRLEESEKKRIRDAVKELGDEDFDRREAAMATLREIGTPARRFLKAAMRLDDEEVKNRAQTLLAEIAEAEPSSGAAGAVDSGMEPLADTDDDELVTRRFTIRGRVLSDKFQVKTVYGALEVERDKIVGILLDSGAKISKRLSVPSSAMVPNGWVDTRLNLFAGRSIVIRAKGLLSVPNYSLTSGPEGTKRYSGSTFGGFPMLSLVGKIGRKGKPFLIAREVKKKVKKEGKLYVGIVPFRRNYPATGAYKVHIQSRE